MMKLAHDVASTAFGLTLAAVLTIAALDISKMAGCQNLGRAMGVPTFYVHFDACYVIKQTSKPAPKRQPMY